MEKRTFVIGDLHGGLRALEQVLERASVGSDDTIIFLGDYTDGWGESFELIEYLIELDNTHDCIFLKGNHDVWCEQYLRTGLEPVLGFNTTWRHRGGLSTMKGYEKEPHGDWMENHRSFFHRLHNFYEDDEGRVFVHGGFTQGGGVRFENPTRNLWWDRSLLEMAYTHSNKHKVGSEGYTEFYPKILKTYKEIFVGHTTTQHYETLQPLMVCNLINMDTGCGHRHGKLSIMDMDTKEHWQSDLLKDLYPDDPHNEFHKLEGLHLI